MDFNKLTSFGDFCNFLREKTEKEKGVHFELLCKYVFLHHYSLNNEVKNCWLYKEIPQDTLNKLKLPSIDKGIDILVEYKEGTYSVVQCKYRTDVESSITQSELSTFFAQILRQDRKHENKTKAILMTNTIKVTKEVEELDIKMFGNEFFEGLNKDFFGIISGAIKKGPRTTILRNYQNDCVDKVTEYLKTQSKAHIIMACGTGKTIISYNIDKRLKTKKTVIFVPSLYLLSQLYHTFVGENYGQADYLLIGSSSDIDKNYASNLSVTTDETVIKQKYETKNKLFVICTYQSSKLLKGFNFDLAIFDEAHRTAGNDEFSYALYDKNVPINKRLFVTATKKSYTGDNEEIYMNNEELYGQLLYEYNIRSAINDGYLNPYVVEIMKIDDEELKKYKERNTVLNTDEGTFETHTLAAMAMIKQLFEKKQINHLLTYHSSVKNAKNFKNALEKILKDVKVNHINGSDSCGERNRVIKDFVLNERAIITSSQVLNEGVDIPIVDAVCFVDGRSSEINIIQCIGRALRKCPRKNLSRILVPVVDTELKSGSVFKSLMNIIKSLSDYDHTLTEYLKTKSKDTENKVSIINITEYIEKEKSGNRNVGMEELEEKIKTEIYHAVFSTSLTTYERARKIIGNSAKTIKEYLELCEKDFRLPKDPHIYKEFKHWIEYLNLEDSYYDLKNCKTKIKDYIEAGKVRHVETDINATIEKSCEIDNKIPPPDFIREYYGLNSLEQVMLPFKMHKRRTL